MFLAIISDTYSEVKADLSVSERRFPVSDYLDSIKSEVYKKMNCYPEDSQTIASGIVLKSSIFTISIIANFGDRLCTDFELEKPFVIWT